MLLDSSVVEVGEIEQEEIVALEDIIIENDFAQTPILSL